MTAANLAGSNAGPWDAADHLASVDDMAACLEAALDEADTALFAAALGDVARAKAMSKIARGAGVGRESHYKALPADGNPELAAVLKALRSHGSRPPATAVQEDRETGRAGRAAVRLDLESAQAAESRDHGSGQR